LNLTDISLSEKPYWALGFSAAVTNFLSMRMGIMGKSGSARVTIGSAIDLNKISLDINYSLDLMTQIQPLNRVSLGVRFNLGDGGRAATAAKVDELYLLGLDAYGRGDNAGALSCWQEALRLNPKFQPAREGINVIAQAMNIQQRIKDMQTLDF
ncbi:MAG: tetratricopeptide repeat protein, partial [Treponema sp.]|nr:tetratricopeptide repeat protein [Treponema sp.]